MKSKKPLVETAYITLMRPKSPWKKSAKQRAEMTMACGDADYIPRVKQAGSSKKINGVDVQVMHNGLMVKKNGYQGEWQAETIKKLKGVHEPQEEKVFYEVLDRIDKATSMIELGSWWSYYSMWFLKNYPTARAICCEPDPDNIILGKANMELNKFKVGSQAVFYPVASGPVDGKKISFKTEKGNTLAVTTKTIDSVVSSEGLKVVDILHFDIQGAELDTLYGAQGSINKGKIRFVFISTHHYSISEDPLIHQKCIEFIKNNGGSIVASHGILESCSGDGLIVASFDSRDADFHIDVSLQPTSDSLFRPYEQDVQILWESHDKITRYLKGVESELQEKTERLEKVERDLSEIAHLKDHMIRQLKAKVSKLKGSTK